MTRLIHAKLNFTIMSLAFTGILFIIFLGYSQTSKSRFKQQDISSKTADGESLAGHFAVPSHAMGFLHVPMRDAQQLFYKQCTTPVAPPCRALRRFGSLGDGGYDVCLSGSYNLTAGDCLIYSFGIAKQWDFDDALQQHGCEVHSFDPSIGLKSHTRAANHNFHDVGIWHENVVNDKGWRLQTLTSIIEQLGHANRVIDVLKIDVEGAEWPVLSHWLTTNVLANIKQLIFEIHTPVLKRNRMSVQHYESIYNNLGQLRESVGFHLYLEHHKNRCCHRFAVLTPAKMAGMGRDICCYELFFLNINYNTE